MIFFMVPINRYSDCNSKKIIKQKGERTHERKIVEFSDKENSDSYVRTHVVFCSVCLHGA